MLGKRLEGVPVIVDADRQRAARRVVPEYGIDTAILDDGFQQWQTKKDLEIVTVDATDPFGNRHLLPRGILREPLSALKRADIFVFTKTNLNPDTEDIKSALREINPRAAIFEAAHVPVGFYALREPGQILSPDIFKDKAVTLFCGIGDPDSFENLISGMGIRPALFFRFPDHYRYMPRDWENIARSSREKGIDTLITTEKDAARLEELGVKVPLAGIFVLRIELKIIRDEEGFLDRLLGLYRL
jgi:tetraacyldisaccharide 4'-kinase